MAADLTPAPIPESFPNAGVAGVQGGKGVLRERFDAMKQVAIDDAMDKKDSWAKQVSNGTSGVRLDDMPRLIRALGLKLVDQSRVCISPEQIEEYEAYKVIAKRHLTPQATLDPESF